VPTLRTRKTEPALRVTISDVSDTVDARSKLLFNNVYVLRVATAIGAGNEVVDSRTLQVELGLGQSAVHRVLQVLEGVSLVDRLDRSSRTEPLRFLRRNSSFWTAMSELADA
jgi:hypothetical protein